MRPPVHWLLLTIQLAITQVLSRLNFDCTFQCKDAHWQKNIEIAVQADSNDLTGIYKFGVFHTIDNLSLRSRESVSEIVPPQDQQRLPGTHLDPRMTLRANTGV